MKTQTQCAIAGGGPAGLMLGVLLARAGVDVLVLEKHGDFLRDFRGDTIHPSTMTVLDELGWLEDFLTLPHQKVRNLTAKFGDKDYKIADFSHLAVKAPYIAMIPQWDFLNFLTAKGKQFPNFELAMNTEALSLVTGSGRVAGVKVRGPMGEQTITANLVVAADGRASVLRQSAGLTAQDFGAPMDALWFRLPRKASDTDQTQARFDAGRIFVMLNRGEYWQCAFVIPKGGNDKIRAAGLEAFRAGLAPLLPIEATRAAAITDWEQVKLLTVKVDRLTEWARPGLLCIGDAAHAMSPLGGVGINLAIQDAVAAANLLAKPLRENRLSFQELQSVQARRAFPTRMIQNMQIFLQRQMIAPALTGTTAPKPPLPLRIMLNTPFLNRLPARLIGLGVRPEHVARGIREGRG